MKISQLIELGFQHHSAGRLAEAERLYRQVLAQNPNQPAALHLLGTLLHQKGQNAEAAQLVARSIKLYPHDPTAQINLAAIYRELGNADEAVSAGRRAVALAPGQPESHNNLGLALKMKGMLAEARDALSEAVRLRPEYVEALMNLGNVLVDLGDPQQATDIHHRAIQIRPTASGYHNLGIALRAAKKQDHAIVAFERAVQLAPCAVDFMATLGDAYLEAERHEDAIDVYRAALAIQPDFGRIFDNLGSALLELNRVEESIDAYHRALKGRPTSAGTHFNLAISLLANGDYDQGWKEYEWRWKWSDFTAAPRNFTQPAWDGTINPAGKTILIHAEQGFGDTLQFVRYAPLLKARGARVIIECQPELVRLVRSIGIERVVARGESLPTFDLRIAMLNLPLAMGTTTLDAIPSQTPYLHAVTQDVERWRSRIAEERKSASTPAIGLAWAGNPGRKQDHVRSIPLSMLTRLTAARDATFYSLQFGEPAHQINEVSGVIDHTAELSDFAETAALIEALDLVITVDTATAHLAGALGKPVWILLPFSGGWRWLVNRCDSPWYPSARLFRQTRRGDWTGPVEAASKALTSSHP